MPENPTIEAIRYLASVCDGAVEEDTRGYNAGDSRPGKGLAMIPDYAWTADMVAEGARMILKYKAQIEGVGIDYAAIQAAAKSPLECGHLRELGADVLRDAEDLDSRVIVPDGRDYEVRFKYSPRLVKAVKALPWRRFDAKSKVWRVPPESASQLLVFAETHGFDISAVRDALMSEAAEAPEPAPCGVFLEKERITIRFEYDPDMVKLVKRIPGARWNPDEKLWWTKPEAGLAVVEALEGRLHISDAILKATAAERMKHEQLIEASQQADADFVIEGLGGELRPFQRAGALYAVSAGGRVFIADEQGLGKTIQGLAFTQAVGGFPLLVVCPASVKLNWAREARKWLPGRSVAVASSKEALPRADVVVINYDILKKLMIANPKDAQKDWKAWIKYETIIFDESHYLKTPNKQRTSAAKALAALAQNVLMLSGTPIKNRPKELISQLQILGRFDEVFGSWKNFVTRYCGAYRDSFGWNLDGAQHLDELNEKLRRTCYVRRLKSQVLTELPAKQRSIVPVQMTNWGPYNRALANVIEFVGAQAAADEEFQASVAHLEPDKRNAAIKARRESAEHRAAKAEQLVRIEALKQCAVRGKFAAAMTWIHDFLESGEKLIIFGDHVDICNEIARELDCPIITGEVSTDDGSRQRAVDAFQDDDDVRAIVLNQAGKEGLTLTAASNVAFLEFFWTPTDHDQAEDRAHRIGQTRSVNCWYLAADGTIDDDMIALLDEKRKVVKAATEGGNAASTSILNDLLRRIQE